jgi:hypothetical protein
MKAVTVNTLTTTTNNLRSKTKKGINEHLKGTLNLNASLLKVILAICD